MRVKNCQGKREGGKRDGEISREGNGVREGINEEGEKK